MTASVKALSRARLAAGLPSALPPVAHEWLDLPERVVQFGTGAFLRGFVDAFIDEANRKGQFDGRVVAIGSTGSGRTDALNAQDGLYTLSLRGVEAGVPVRRDRIIASVSRALSATDQWGEALAVARNPLLEVVVSNTTEVGIRLSDDDVLNDQPPASFPGKLTRFLYERGRTFDFAPEYGVVVLPCELIEDNGTRLGAIVRELAERSRLDPRFFSWLDCAVPFCNTLVDRIVTGKPEAAELNAIQAELGYTDQLYTVGERYSLFAIEASEVVGARLRFARAIPSIMVTPDITPYRERKLRLLNGTHTLLAPLSLACGCRTVHEATRHELIGPFLDRLLFHELVPTVQHTGAAEFAAEVRERFANPYIEHDLSDLLLQASTKMRVRVLPSIVRYLDQRGQVPPLMCFAFAAFLYFMQGELQESRRGKLELVDDLADRFAGAWASVGTGAMAAAAVARKICADRSIWETDLTRLPGLTDGVAGQLEKMLSEGVPAALAGMIRQPAAASRI